MAIVRDRDLVENWDDQIPVELIDSCIKEHQQGLTRLNELENYYLGKHKILDRKLSNTQLPNNKLVANHAKYITDVATGYLTGNPVKYEGGKIDSIIDVYDKIDINSHDAELAKDLSIFGIGLELYYMSSDDVPIPQVALIDPRFIFLVVDDTVESKPLFACHYYEKHDIDNKVVGYKINIYTATKVYAYETDSLDSKSRKEFKLVAEDQQFFGGVPVIEYQNNEESQGDFEQQISLIDAYNLIMSDRVNDKEQLVDALLVVVNASLGDDEEAMTETAKFIREHKILELPEDSDAKWLVKSLNESDVEILKEAIREDIHQFSMVPNLTDKNFASNASGVAMKYKLFGLEQLMKIKERYFKKGLKERLKLFANVLAVKGKAVDVSDVKITMTRSLPANELEIAQMVSTLNSLVSDETLLSQLPFVVDPAEEVAKLEEQKNKAAERSQKAFGFPMDQGNGGVIDGQAQ